MKKDSWLKVASVVLAVGIWAFVISRGQSEVFVEAPVVFRGVPAGLQITENGPKTVTLGVRGHERFIRELNPGDIRISLDMRDARKGIHQYRINSSDVKLPPPLRLISASPSILKLHVVETMRKALPVRAVITGIPLKGYRISHVEVMPEEVVVEGAMPDVRKLNALDTEPVDIASATETVVSEVRIRRPAAFVRPETESVTVRVVIIREAG